MQLKNALWCAVLLTAAGCGSSEPGAPIESAEPRPTVFDPLTGTLDRAEGVQQTIDQQAAEQRRRIEDAER